MQRHRSRLLVASAVALATLAAAPAPVAAALPAPIAFQAERMGSYTGGPPSAIPTRLRNRARFLGQDLTELESEPQTGCVVLQSPAPGESLGADTPIAFLVAQSVPTPDFTGMSYLAAQQLADSLCLSVVEVASCSGDSAAPLVNDPNATVVQQCTPPETLVDIGNEIGVVVSPSDDPHPLTSAIVLAAAAVAAAAAAFALAYYLRYRAARDELEIFKSPRRRE